MDSSPHFISSKVIERLEKGSFVPARRSQAGALQMSDRRNVLSPLNVTRRCVRYDPKVFRDRKDTLIHLAKTLNAPVKKIILIGGPQGSGKTSLTRGLIELMGSGTEQLLWFDANRHTDYEEIIHFLIQYVTYLFSALGESATGTSSQTMEQAATETNPIKRLEGLIQGLQHVPLLLVIDNAEYIVDTELRFNSYPFKEMLNFLLSFPNIKMVLVGERLPLADMSPNQEGVQDIKLGGLEKSQSLEYLKSKHRGGWTEVDIQAAREMTLATQGMPWLLKVLLYLHHHAKLEYEALARLLKEAGGDALRQDTMLALARFIYTKLNEPQRRWLHILCLVRHPVDVHALKSLYGYCFPPALGQQEMALEISTIEDALDSSLIKAILKVQYPPQDVLEHLRREAVHKTGEKFKPWYELYHAIRRVLYSHLPAEEKERLHGTLQDFYLREKGRTSEDRILRLKSKALIAEARHHGSVSRTRTPARSEDTSPYMYQPDGWQEGVPVGDVDTQAYLYRNVKPLTRNRAFTLEDYRQLKLPDENEEMEFSAASLDELLPGPEEDKISFRDHFSSLELSEEERRLLRLDEPRKEPGAVKPVNEATVSSAEPKEQHEKPAPPSALTPDMQILTGDLTPGMDVDEQEKELQAQLAKAVSAKDRRTMLKHLLALAQYRAGKGKLEAAINCLDKALTLKEVAKKETLSEIYRLKGSIDKESYRHNRALISLTQAARLIRTLMYEDDTVGLVWFERMGEVFQNMGEIYAYRRQYPEAAESFNQALRWFSSADEEARQSEVHFRLAGVYEDLQDPDNAKKHYEISLKMDEALGNAVACAASLSNLGHLYLDEDNLSEAYRCFSEAFRHDQTAGNTEGQLRSLENMVTLSLEEDNIEQAEVTAKQGLTLALAADDNTWKATFYAKLGQIYMSDEQWAQARQHFEWAYSAGERELSQESLDWIRNRIFEITQQMKMSG